MGDSNFKLDWQPPWQPAASVTAPTAERVAATGSTLRGVASAGCMPPALKPRTHDRSGSANLDIPVAKRSRGPAPVPAALRQPQRAAGAAVAQGITELSHRPARAPIGLAGMETAAPASGSLPAVLQLCLAQRPDVPFAVRIGSPAVPLTHEAAERLSYILSQVKVVTGRPEQGVYASSPIDSDIRVLLHVRKDEFLQMVRIVDADGNKQDCRFLPESAPSVSTTSTQRGVEPGPAVAVDEAAISESARGPGVAPRRSDAPAANATSAEMAAGNPANQWALEHVSRAASAAQGIELRQLNAVTTLIENLGKVGFAVTQFRDATEALPFAVQLGLIKRYKVSRYTPDLMLNRLREYIPANEQLQIPGHAAGRQAPHPSASPVLQDFHHAWRRTHDAGRLVLDVKKFADKLLKDKLISQQSCEILQNLELPNIDPDEKPGLRIVKAMEEDAGMDGMHRASLVSKIKDLHKLGFSLDRFGFGRNTVGAEPLPPWLQHDLVAATGWRSASDSQFWRDSFSKHVKRLPDNNSPPPLRDRERFVAEQVAEGLMTSKLADRFSERQGAPFESDLRVINMNSEANYLAVKAQRAKSSMSELELERFIQLTLETDQLSAPRAAPSPLTEPAAGSTSQGAPSESPHARQPTPRHEDGPADQEQPGFGGLMSGYSDENRLLDMVQANGPLSNADREALERLFMG